MVSYNLRRKLALFSITCLVVCWTSYVLVTRFKVQSDLWAFLPTVGDSPEQRLTRTLLSGQLSQALVLAVVPEPVDCVESASCSEANKDAAKKIARTLALELSQNPSVRSAQSGPQPGFEAAVHDLYFPRRFALARSAAGTTYSTQDIDAHVNELRAFLASPQAAMYRSQLVSDPMLYFPEQIKRLASLKPSGIEVVDDQFVSSGGIAFVLSSVHTGLSGEEKAGLYRDILARFSELNNASSTRLLTSGALPFEVQGEAASRADMARVSLISTVMTVVLSLLLFRSLLTMGAVSVPVGFGFAFGCAITLLVFGEVHVLTLAFGASLVGVTLDYPLHILNEAALMQCGLAEARTRTRTGLLIGSLTTGIAFLTFGLTSAPALLQVAVFSVAGLFGALMVSLYLIPELPLRYGPGKIQGYFRDQLSRALPTLSRLARPILALSSAYLIFCAWVVFSAEYHTEPSWLDPSPIGLKNDDRYVRESLGLSENMLVVSDTAKATALERSYALALDLEQRQHTGQIENYRSLFALYLPQHVQEKNRALASSSETRQHFMSALSRSDFNPEAFSESSLGTKAVEALPLLSLDELLASPLGDLARPFLFSSHQGTSVVTQVSAKPEQIQAILADHPHVSHYEPEKFLAQSFSQLAYDVRLALLTALALMFSLVAIRNRGALRVIIAAFFPAALGALGSLALVSMMDKLHVFHLLAAVVVLGMGIDYGTFMVEAHRRDARPDAWPSVVSAAITTLVSFGCLGLSSVPALRAIGLIVGIGTLISLLTTPLSYSVLAAASKQTRGAS